MTEETAVMVLWLIAGVGALVWLLGMAYVLRSRSARARALARGEEPSESPGFRSRELEDGGTKGTTAVISGSADVEGAPEDLVSRAAHVMAVGGLGQTRIVSRSQDRLVFEGTIQPEGKRRHGPRSYRGGFRFTPANTSRTRVEYLLEIPGARWALILAGVFQFLGLAALVGGFWALSTFVAHSDDSVVRAQVLQMMQAVHFLWPPFLFAFVYRRWGLFLRRTVETLLANLPYVRVAE
jgi:hypothetical protein